MKRFAIPFLMLAFFVGSVQADPKVDCQDAKQKPAHGRGFVMPDKATLDARHAEAFKRHGHRMKALPTATPAQYDCRTFGYVPPIKDQGSCGSCYQFGVDICEMQFMKAGLMPVTSGGLAEQYGMDCKNFGGCNGGDEAECIDWCKVNGYPATSDYGPYQARSASCRLKSGTKMWKIADWGYCHSDQGQGIASVQEIKNAMVQYGPISIALDASGFDNYNGGVLSGTGHSIDHAVILIGWDDTKGTKGAWLLRNQWGTSWGIDGYMWIAYGAYDVGTEAIWCTAGALPPPTPVPPTPTPTPGGTQYTMQTNTDGTITFTPVKPAVSIPVTRATTLGEIIDAINTGKTVEIPKKLPAGPKEEGRRLEELERRMTSAESAINATLTHIEAMQGILKDHRGEIARLKANPFNPYAEARGK